jgi:hypothetical protein
MWWEGFFFLWFFRSVFPVLMRWPHAFLSAQPALFPFFSFWFFYSFFLYHRLLLVASLMYTLYTLSHKEFGATHSFSIICSSVSAFFFRVCPPPSLARQLGKKLTLRYGWRLRNNARCQPHSVCFSFYLFPLSRERHFSLRAWKNLCTEMETEDCPAPSGIS